MAGKYEREFEEEGSGRLETSRRGYWANKAEFILACFGNAWGATTWVRFPYLCYSYGGFPVFFLAYVIMLIHLGIPMMLLEMTLGQYSSQGVLSVWRLCPLFKGVGVSILLYGCVYLSYSVQYISWPIYYLYVSFTSEWLRCDNAWNTDKCLDALALKLQFLNQTSCMDKSYQVNYDGYCYYNGVRVAIHDDYTYNTQQFSTPIEEFFSNAFLMKTHAGDFNIGDMVWKRILCLAVCWIVIAVTLCVGVRSLGKVVYFTSTVPILLLIAFLIRALTLPGSSEGMRYLFLPNFDKLSDLYLWSAAASEVIFGLGIGYGGYLTLASYNRFQNFYVLDAMLVVIVHIIVRLMVAVIVLGFIGYLAYQTNISMPALMTSGPNLIYVVIPDVLLRIPATPAWWFFFFLTVFLMQLGSILPIMEMVSTAICDLWRPLLRLRFVLVGILSSAFFLIGILFCTTAGYNLFNTLDLHLHPFYGSPIICAMSVCIVFYGICWTGRDIKLMIGDRNICWLIIAALVLIPAAIQWFLLPLTSIAYLVFSAIQYYPPSSLSWWSPYAGFGTLGIILLPMLLWPIIMFIVACIRRCRCGPVFRPESMWGPHLSRFRVRATHLPHINVSPLTAEGIKLDRMAPIARYDN